MGENHNTTGDHGRRKGSITRHMLIGVVLAVVVLIAPKIVFGLFDSSESGFNRVSGVGA